MFPASALICHCGPGHKLPRKNGVFITDCWDDVRELTSGYFAETRP